MTAAVCTCVLLAWSLLVAADAREGELSFMVIGDWGGQPTAPYTTAAEREVAQQMGKTAAALGSSFTVALGDNFYDTGVTSAHDPRFQETFEVSPAKCVAGVADQIARCSTECS